ncbi:malto-oligosyltrehalose trehalohydrolase [Parapedobacter koreensis]|uniref:Malto-oligosyltrehalose trehalohydrolase n=1 Tax=Parapedobacter koreensis TaxID=332977 RepID=A0A1H7T3U1_9SPHI|nr:malto-oligosyltrehalose trehalohydrolase [Parapedobacter koreensis]SEL78467.1 maltooligosyl trehalose hydrolase [Parapedobacter koreensis]
MYKSTHHAIAGAHLHADGKCLFRIWAPLKQTVALHIVSPEERRIPLTRSTDGYFETEVADCPAATHYYFNPDGEGDFPDPASHFQPEGVHGPSAVVDHGTFTWSDQAWENPALSELILYELHVGTFTEAGTFDAIIPYLEDLAAMGINAIELMPVAQFPGHRNWGYDGTFPYAVHASYGGPDGLKRLVDACHRRGIAVILDVVYNHLGPEGNYFNAFAPYFTDAYRTPWGSALNFDGPWSDGVRDYFTANAIHWFHHYHIDGLRLDAIHAIIDTGATHALQYINEVVASYAQQARKPLHLIAESDLNAPRVIQSTKTNGYGFDAQWLDDFHHALFVLLYPVGKEQYEDFGTLAQLAKAYTEGFVHSGEYVSARQRKYGASSAGIPGFKFVAFIQNHDQVGNHKNGERLSVLLSGAQLRIAAAALLLSPYIPMLFMGEEYGEERPFLYFTSHDDPQLVEQIREGRRQEFAHFFGDGEPPDPQDEKTFKASILDWPKRGQGKYQQLLMWYQRLIHLRRTHTALHNFNKTGTEVDVLSESAWSLLRQDETGQSQILALFNLADRPFPYTLPQNTTWICLLDSTMADPQAGSTVNPDVLVLPPVCVLIFASTT